MFEILDELMKEKGITIYKLSKDTGISSTTFYAWRKGDYTPKREKIELIADYFGVTYDYLIGKQKTVVTNKIPILGYVPCGIPIEAVEDVLGYATVGHVVSDEYFALYARGNSMTPDIKKGDLLIVKLCSYVDSGKIAIVKIDGNEATCKKVIYNSDGLTLISLNSDYDPMVFTKEEVANTPVTIIGEVKEIRRQL